MDTSTRDDRPARPPVRFNIKLPQEAFEALRRSGADRALDPRHEASRVVLEDLRRRGLWTPPAEPE